MKSVIVSNLEALSQKLPPEANIRLQPSLIEGIPDGVLALVLPIVAYWTYSTFFHILDVYELAERYRIHPSEEEESRNKVTLHEVVKDVIFQHIIQTIAGIIFFFFDKKPTVGQEMYEMWKMRHSWWFPQALPNWTVYYCYFYGISLVKICISLFIIDSWQYWLHRIMHMNKWLYRRFHSRHHRLYVPYAYGALYNDPVEGFLLDTLGTGVATLCTGLTPRESMILFTFATMKTVDDHCGYKLPYDIFQIIFPNNSVYHDIHHQIWGIKHNFSQPFFTIWDKYLGTEYQFVEEFKSMQKSITLARYKEFLKKKERKKNNNQSQKSQQQKEQEDKKDI